MKGMFLKSTHCDGVDDNVSGIYPMTDNVGPSVSFLTAFVGVDGSKADLKLPPGNTWYYSRSVLSI